MANKKIRKPVLRVHIYTLPSSEQKVGQMTFNGYIDMQTAGQVMAFIGDKLYTQKGTKKHAAPNEN